MTNLNDIPFNATCALTGKNDNLRMYAHRNDKGDMIGWVFLHESIEPSSMNIRVIVNDLRPPRNGYGDIVGFHSKGSGIDNL